MCDGCGGSEVVHSTMQAAPQMIYDKPVVGWKVWLADGRVVENEWDSLPDLILGVVVYYEKPYCRVLYGDDYYAKKGDMWGSADDLSLLCGVVKCGKLVDDKMFEETLVRLHDAEKRP